LARAATPNVGLTSLRRPFWTGAMATSQVSREKIGFTYENYVHLPEARRNEILEDPLVWGTP